MTIIITILLLEFITDYFHSIQPQEASMVDLCCLNYKETGILEEECGQLNIDSETCSEYFKEIQIEELKITLTSIIIASPISYLISCLIVWIYDKYKK